MTIGEIIAGASAVVSSVCAAFTVFQASRWRNSDDAKAIDERIKAVEDRTLEHGVQLKDLPSKADLASVRSDVHNLDRTVAGIDAGVTRIEQFLMSNGGRS